MGIKQDVTKTWDSVPPIVRGTIYVAAIGVIGYQGYRFYKKWKIEQEAQELKDKMAAYERAGIKPTYGDLTYKQWHDTILSEGESLNTNEDKIYDIFRKMKNEVDFIKLQEYTYTIGVVWKQTYTLSQYLVDHALDEDEIQQVNAILRSKNINYQF